MDNDQLREMLETVTEFTLRGPQQCRQGEPSISIVRRHPDKDSWAITISGAWNWCRDGKVRDELLPSARTDAFLRKARWTLEEAWAEGKRLVALGTDIP